MVLTKITSAEDTQFEHLLRCQLWLKVSLGEVLVGSLEHVPSYGTVAKRMT